MIFIIKGGFVLYLQEFCWQFTDEHDLQIQPKIMGLDLSNLTHSFKWIRLVIVHLRDIKNWQFLL